jgi:hypothetical protein
VPYRLPAASQIRGAWGSFPPRFTLKLCNAFSVHLPLFEINSKTVPSRRHSLECPLRLWFRIDSRPCRRLAQRRESIRAGREQGSCYCERHENDAARRDEYNERFLAWHRCAPLKLPESHWLSQAELITYPTPSADTIGVSTGQFRSCRLLGTLEFSLTAFRPSVRQPHHRRRSPSGPFELLFCFSRTSSSPQLLQFPLEPSACPVTRRTKHYLDQQRTVPGAATTQILSFTPTSDFFGLHVSLPVPLIGTSAQERTATSVT